MKSTKEIIANNITTLRKKAGYTQSQLATKLNYSDKAVSKWERNETSPDVDVLFSIADIFGVPIDYFFYEHIDSEVTAKRLVVRKQTLQMLTLITATLMIPVAIYVYFLFKDAEKYASTSWIGFVWMLPVMAIILIGYFVKLKILIGCILSESALIWTFLTAVFVNGILFGQNLWMVYLIGIPLQIFILIRNLLNLNK